MAKVAVVGRADSILCFLASGFRAFPADGTEEAKEAVRQAKKEGSDVIFVTPDLKEVINWADEKYGESVTPAVIPLPLGSGEAAKERLTSFVERAVGANILGD
ncbi:MAG: V-type ATP synthase subunit F, partial [Clostridia bacterium]|nr:V-type ATP synthase subunit F [Clostridia bacterium]MBR7032513.1 V-type ATP synthase subunit F [Clostridia bacterium]